LESAGFDRFAIFVFASRPGRFLARKSFLPVVAKCSTGMIALVHPGWQPGKRRRALVETNPPRNTRLRLIETVRNTGDEVKIRFVSGVQITGRKIADASENSCD
jgi:hypothetical protein